MNLIRIRRLPEQTRQERGGGKGKSKRKVQPFGISMRAIGPLSWDSTWVAVSSGPLGLSLIWFGSFCWKNDMNLNEKLTSLMS